MSAILPGLQAFSSAFNRIAMKKLLYILAGLGLAACTSDIEELPEVGPQPGREVALTGISGTASRTQFVPGDGTEIQFQWSTGDRIWAGGVQSAEAGTDGNVADFGFTNRSRRRFSGRRMPFGQSKICRSFPRFTWGIYVTRLSERII